LSTTAHPQEGGAAGFHYTALIQPPRPETGELLVYELRVEGFSAASSRTTEFLPGPGLALESESIHPFVGPSSRGAAFRFELRVLESSELRIESLAVEASEGALRLGPIVLRQAAAQPAQTEPAPSAPAPPEPGRKGEALPQAGPPPTSPTPPATVGAGGKRALGGRALAAIYGAYRRAPPFSKEARVAKKAALARASELGTAPPLRDALPPPAFFAWPAFIVAFMGLALFIVSRLGRRPGRLVAAGALLAVAIALGAFGLAASLERRERYAVIWADSLRTVPSAEAERSVKLLRGSTARARGSSGAYESVLLPDGIEGWALRDSLFWY
jgi:hypothetical protein